MSKTRGWTWVQALCWPALALALLGSVSNLAWAFASVQSGNLVLGYVQAGAVDLGLIALAVGVAARRKAQRPAFWLWVGLVFCGVVSTYGNLLHGYAHAQAVNAPVALAVLRPVALAAVLPALVLILAEVVGHDARSASATVRGTSRAENVTPQVTNGAKFRDAPRNDGRCATHTATGNGGPEWHALALRLRAERPEMTQAAIAEACGVSPSRVSRLLRQEVV